MIRELVEISGAVVGVILLLICLLASLLTLGAWFNGSLFDNAHEDNRVKVYCESIAGNYGDGICFKDGKQMKPEEEE